MTAETRSAQRKLLFSLRALRGSAVRPCSPSRFALEVGRVRLSAPRMYKTSFRVRARSLRLRRAGTDAPYRGNPLDVVHLLLVDALIQDLLEGDAIGDGLHRVPELLPGAAQLRSALRIV
jgi:hypothetical protein